MGKTKKNRKSTFAQNLILRRKELGFSSAVDFAASAKIPYPTVRNIEAGVSDGSRSTREAIAKALKTTVDILSTPAQAQRLTTVNSEKSDLLLRLYTVLPTLHEDELRGLLPIVEGMPSRLHSKAPANIKGS